MARVRFNDVTKRFDEGVTALSHFSLSIDQGELLVLVGPSGCGKSTALRLLAGLESVTAGEILIDDEIVNASTPQQRNIAMVFQNYALYPHMSVRENLAFPLRMARMNRRQIAGRVDEIAQILNLSELLQRRPKQLSGGQRQRVAMGRALVRDPRVFLLDEPLSNLDARLRAQIRSDIADIQQRLHKTTVYVTHDQVEAMTLGHRVAVMNHGVLQQAGTPQELYTRPANTFVAGFIGSPGMNIFASTLVADNGETGIAVGGRTLFLPVSDRRAQQLSPGDELYIGIRPEAFNLAPADHRLAISIVVQSIEYLGHESLVYFCLSEAGARRDNGVWIARISGRFDQSADDVLELHVDRDAIYLFDRDGVAIDA